MNVSGLKSYSALSMLFTDLYHCVFGDLEESLQSCCRKALEMACEKELHNVVFWVDGFASISGNATV